LHSDYEGVFIPFDSLLRLQTAKDLNESKSVEILKNILTQMIENQIQKHKKATGGVKGALKIRGRGER